MKNISVVISAYNEEEKIEACLRSAKKIASEIIVIDNTSQDKTKKIAQKYTDKVFTRDNNLMLNVNKNFGIRKATGDWIFVLDADERITDELAEEISNKKNSTEKKIAAYKIPRKNIIFGKWIRYTGWYPDYQTRFFKKKKGMFEEEHNHEQLSVEGEIGKLENHLYHNHYKTINEFIQKTINIYTQNEVDNLINKGYKFNYADCITFPFQEFLSRYFARKGYKDGFHGLVLSITMALYHFIVFLKLWESHKFPEQSSQETLNMLRTETIKMKKEYTHWQNQVAIHETRGVKKIFLKTKNKFLKRIGSN